MGCSIISRGSLAARFAGLFMPRLLTAAALSLATIGGGGGVLAYMMGEAESALISQVLQMVDIWWFIAATVGAAWLLAVNAVSDGLAVGAVARERGVMELFQARSIRTGE